MRHIPLDDILSRIYSTAAGKTVRARLLKTHIKMASVAPLVRQRYIRRYGSRFWSPMKNHLTSILGDKCWYTEVEIVGAPLTIDHYRPVCDYWWLAFDSDNYRVACSHANSLHQNPLYPRAGGKVDNFPLLPPKIPATGKNKLRIEKPIILDPCQKADCDLLAFDTTGRPILNPIYGGNDIAEKRVEASKLLLNLDHPDFNSKRCVLRSEIALEVRVHEKLPAASEEREEIRAKLAARLAPTAPYSVAARYYLRDHRHLDWVENLLKTN